MTDEPGQPSDPLPSPPPPADPPVPPPPVREIIPPNPRDRWAHRRGEPRVFAFLWTVFLFAATTATFVSAFASGSASPDVMRPATRALMAVTLIGIVIVWPLIRLSQAADRHPIAGCIQDLVVILIPAQAVIWPQWFGWLGRWPLSVVGAVSVLCVAWALFIGGVLALAQTSHAVSVHRQTRFSAWPWMSLIVLLVIGGTSLALWHISPAPAAADPHQELFRPSWMLSPVTGVYEITRDRSWTGTSAAVVRSHWISLAAIAAAGLPFWIAAGLRSRGIREGGGLH